MQNVLYVGKAFLYAFYKATFTLFTKKLIRVMKIIPVFLLVACLQVNAKSNAQTITLTLKKAPIGVVFKQIKKQSNYSIVYNNSLLARAKKINISVSNASVEEVLKQSLKGQPFSYVIIEKTIIIKPLEKVPVQENTVIKNEDYQQIIKGRVTNSRGEALAGVTVKIKGTETATATNEKGEFTITASSDRCTLIFTTVGFTDKEVEVTNSEFIRVVMIEELKKLNDVVVTGIYDRKASSYTGAAVTITREELKRTGNSNLFQSLKNISPSLILDNFVEGSDPNAMPDVRVRGTSSLPESVAGSGYNLKGNYLKNPNEPLFILDGFETTIEHVLDLDINRIETVTILKDASSKALYGSKAANGVIVIETRKIYSDKPLVMYNMSLDIELPDLSSYNLTNSKEKLEAERIDGMYKANPIGYDPPAEAVELMQLYNFRRKLVMEGLNTDWLAKPVRNGIGQKHAITVELGGENLRILGDFSYRHEEGAMKGSSRQNISGSLSTSYRVSNLLFRNITSINSNKSTESPYGLFSDYVKMNPYWRAVNEDGTIPYYAEVGPNGTKYTNPLYNSTVNSKITADYFNMVNNFYLEWKIKPGLKATTRLGINVDRSGADEFYPSSHTKFDSYITEEDKNRRGSYQVNNGRSSDLSGDFNLNYTKEVNKSSFFGDLGFNISERKYSEVIHKVEGFSSNRMDNIIFGRAYALDSRPTGVEGISRDIGFLGAASYTWDDRLLTDLTIRTNASSQFGNNRRWAKFWSFGLGWNLHKENFIKNTGLFKQLKIRGSLGSTGNQNFNTNTSIATYEYYLESLYQGFPGSYLTNMANPNLQWESKFDYNAGLDAKVKGLTLRFDYYVSYTENLLADITLPPSAGFPTVKDNLGRVKNSGIELYTSYLLLSKKRNFISLNFGIETNTNKIIELSNSMKGFNEIMDKQAADKSNNKVVHKYEDGMSMNAIWAVPSLGIDPATGDEIYLDHNGNTTYSWNAADMIVVGNSQPAYQGIFGFNAEYHNIGLSVTGRYLGGGQLYNQTLVDRVENVDMNYNVDKRVLNGRWLAPGQHASFKRLGEYSKEIEGSNSTTSVQEKTRATSRFIQDRNEVTIGAINVYYDFNDFLKNSKIQRLRVGFNMNDVATFSSIRIERGTDYPFAKILSFSISATF